MTSTRYKSAILDFENFSSLIIELDECFLCELSNNFDGGVLPYHIGDRVTTLDVIAYFSHSGRKFNSF